MLAIALTLNTDLDSLVKSSHVPTVLQCFVAIACFILQLHTAARCWLVLPVSYSAGCSPYSMPLHGWSTRPGGRSTSLHCCVNYTGWRYHSGFSSDCAYSRIGVYMALLRPTCPIVYAVSPTSTQVDAYAQPTSQHCCMVPSTRRSTVGDRAFPVAAAHFPWLFVARQHCLRSAGSSRLIFIAVLLTNSSAGSAYRALSDSFSDYTELPQRFFNVWRHLNHTHIYITLHYQSST